MWTVVYVAPNLTRAEAIRDRLSREGILVRLRSIGPESGADQSMEMEILVPKAEVDEALEVLNTL